MGVAAQGRDASKILARQRFLGVSEPTPFGVLIFAQLPFATYFQALP